MRVLFRYPGFPLEGMKNFTGHASKWAWWCIYDCLVELGHEVLSINWNYTLTAIKYINDNGRRAKFDAVFSIQHLDGIEDVMDEDTIKIVRLTAADRHFHNGMVRRRYAAVNGRRGADLQLRRLLEKYSSIADADHILLNGNEWTRSTYPERIRDRIVTMDTCAANATETPLRDFIPENRSFMFHAGSGAVHKGLDLVLEAFSKHPEWNLHITCNLRGEPDFLKEYEYELGLPNIHYHGWTVVASKKFQDILSECYAFILPSCSEGQSPAVATCLTLGLYPIISRYTGIDLPEGCGTYLNGLTTLDIEEAIQSLPDDDELLRQVAILQADAQVRYSREVFRNTMMGYLKGWLK
jgi:glycosyltransferase involved in cell wall biosynthesis